MGRILGPDGQPLEMDVLVEEIAGPNLAGIRQVWHSSVATGLTPPRLASLLQAAVEGDANEYLTLAEEMEERDAHYASVLGTRKLALAGLDVQIEAASDAPADVRLADELRELIAEPEFGEMLAHLTDALGKGFAVSEIIWDRSGRRWRPNYAERDPRWFRWDRDTGRELRLLDAADAANGLPLPAYKFIVHRPRIRSGLPIRGGLARLAAPAYMCKAWTWKDWMAFADIYGLPMRVGTYSQNASKDDIVKLMRAVANLGSDAAAVVPNSTAIKFEAAPNVAGAAEFFHTLASWWDKQVSKGVLGQTMTADDGASLSQARVHQEVREDLLRHDAKTLSNTLQRDLVAPYCALNHGPVARLPRIRVVVPEPDDTAALVDAVHKLVPLGFRVEQSVLRDRLGIPDPAEGAEVMGRSTGEATAPAVPGESVQQTALNGAQITALSEIITKVQDGLLAPARARALVRAGFPAISDEMIGDLIGDRAANRAQNSEERAEPSIPDLIADRLQVESEKAWQEIVAEVGAIVDQAESMEALRDELLNAFSRLPQARLQRVMEMAFAVADLAGRFQAEADSNAG